MRPTTQGIAPLPVTLPRRGSVTDEPQQRHPKTMWRAGGEKRLIDTRQFLEAAELLDAPDVVATCAIHAAIAAADAITCHALGQRSSDLGYRLAPPG